MFRFQYLKPFITFLVFALFSLSALAQDTYVYGYITDAEGQPLENVHVVTKDNKAVSNVQGYYKLNLKADRKFSIVFSLVTHKTHKLKISLKAGETKQKNIQLESNVEEIGVVDLEVKSEDRHSNTIEFEGKDIGLIAGGNNSVEKLIQQNTSAVSNNELSTQYSIRGGNFDENLVYVNGLQIYRPFLVRTGEQEGLSFLNSDMVESIRFSAGGFEAKYGDKLSSVLDITYRESKDLGVKGNLSFQGGGLTVENPFKINGKKLSFIGSYRYKSPTFLLNSLETQGDYNPQFHDFQTYIKYELSSRSELSFLGNYARNTYQFQPESRISTFGTANDVKQVYVYFEGQEIDEYENSNMALKWDFNVTDNFKTSLQASHFRTLEQEFYDIDGYYQLGIVDNNPGSPTYGDVTSITGVGEYLNHARNEFYGEVSNINHRGEIQNKSDNSSIEWGLDVQFEHVEDQLREWQYIDSLGFSVNKDVNNLELYRFVSADNEVNSVRNFGFLQYNKKIYNKEAKTALTYSLGLRANYWNLNDEFFITPRANLSYQPNWKRKMYFRFSAGMYNQSPFYRELRNKQGELNRAAKSQKSFQVTASNDYYLKLWDRDFKMTTELYYKNLWDVIPYELENLQIRYLPFETAKAYTYGLEWRLNGELVEGNESYISFAVMQNKEDLENDNFGFISKPTEQTFSMSIFYQDNFVGHKDIKFHLSGSYATGMPYGPPESARGNQTLRNSSYRRVDVGFSKSLKQKGEQKKGFLKDFEQAWVAIEVLNLLNINNTASHLWVTDAKQTQFAVPNFLTGRMINLKLSFEF